MFVTLVGEWYILLSYANRVHVWRNKQFMTQYLSVHFCGGDTSTRSISHPIPIHPIHEDVLKLRLCVYSLQQLASTGLCRAVFSKLRLLPQNRSGKSPTSETCLTETLHKIALQDIIVKKWARPPGSSGYPEGKYQKYIHFIQKWHTDTHRHTLTQKHTDTHTHQPSSHLNVCTSQDPNVLIKFDQVVREVEVE